MLGIVTQGRRVQARMRSLALLNVELAKVEGKQKATALRIAGGHSLVAAVLALVRFRSEGVRSARSVKPA